MNMIGRKLVTFYTIWAYIFGFFLVFFWFSFRNSSFSPMGSMNDFTLNQAMSSADRRSEPFLRVSPHSSSGIFSSSSPSLDDLISLSEVECNEQIRTYIVEMVPFKVGSGERNRSSGVSMGRLGNKLPIPWTLLLICRNLKKLFLGRPNLANN